MVVFERQLTISGNKSAVPYASLLTLSAAGFSPNLTVKLTENGTTLLNLDGVRLTNDVTIARIVAQSSTKNKDLLGKTCFEQAKVDEVVCLAESVLDGYLNAAEILASISFAKDGSVLGGRLTVADFAVWTILASSDELQKKYSALFKKVLEEPTFVEALAMSGKYTSMAKASGAPKEPKEKVRDEGKFVELPGAEKGKVIVRFPPEASGYLHIGHAKAALLNQYYQQAFDGKLIMRFDDTNPAKENAHFEKVILEDLEMLEIKPDIWSHSSDYFETMLEMAEKLLKESKAFVDDTDTETMRKEREERVESKNRNSSVETNMALWEEMKKGSERGMQCCVRIKMDMNSNNGALRDPTIYRCKPEEHVRTGTRYKVYPTYDFTCPIVDSIEGVTHTLRTTEYHDRDDQYYFICEALGLRKPYIWEYARLNMTNTVMSKRKLTWFVEERHVEGWDDPRLPTVRGVMRRGMTVEGLKQFIVAQGGSRSVVMMEWDKIWAFNKKVIDPVVPRYTALEEKDVVPVIIDGAVPSEETEVALHPKNADVGTKKILRGVKLLVEQTDAREFKIGNIVTFVNWGNLKIVGVEKKGERVVSVKATLDLDNKDYKKTMKVTWLGNTATKSHIPVVCAEYDHIISKAVIGKDEDWKQYINYDSVHYTKMIGEPCLATLKKGDIIQVQRKGFYICDHVYSEKSEFSGNETPLLLIFIPDGSTKKDLPKTEPVAAVKQPGIEAAGVFAEIEQQGVKVRDLKAKDPKGAAAQAAIKELLELKKQYKALTGEDYQPGKPPACPTGIPAPVSSNSTGDLSNQIEAQGTLVRELKGKDPKGAAAQEAIKTLLALKLKYKEATGSEYKPGATPVAATKPAPASSNSAGDLSSQIEAQGTLVRELKGKDPKGAAAQEAIKTLLALKLKYKEATGSEYKPGATPVAASKPASASSNSAGDLSSQIDAQGVLVRELKSKDPKGAAAQEAIAKLLDLKKQYKAATGQEYKPPQTPAPAAAANPCGDAISAEIEKQGSLVRELKSKDAKSPKTKAAIERLLCLKKDYKAATGKDYQPKK